MKKIFKNIGIFILIFNCYSLTAQTLENQLIGTWFFDYESSMAKMGEMSKKHYDKMELVSKNYFEKSYKGRKIIFNKDGSFLQQQPEGSQISGKWLLSNNKPNIIMTNLHGEVLEIKIVRVSNSTLVVKPKSNDKGQMMLSEWYFIKN